MGLANQTTMYKRETREIGQLFEKTLMAKYGPANVGDHWMAFDTICDATQERQVSLFVALCVGHGGVDGGHGVSVGGASGEEEEEEEAFYIIACSEFIPGQSGSASKEIIPKSLLLL